MQLTGVMVMILQIHRPAQNRKKIMIYTKKANPYVGKVMSIINDPDAIQLVR